MWGVALPVGAAIIGGFFDSDSDDEYYEAQRRAEEERRRRIELAKEFERAAQSARQQADIAERASQYAAQHLNEAVTRLTQARAATQIAKELLQQTKIEAEIATARYEVVTDRFANMVTKRLCIEEEAKLRVSKAAPNFPGGEIVVNWTSDAQLAEARELCFQAKREYDQGLRAHQAAQAAVDLGNQHFNEMVTAERAASDYHSQMQNQATNCASQANSAQQAATNAAAELVEHEEYAKEIRAEISQELSGVNIDAAARSRVPVTSPPASPVTDKPDRITTERNRVHQFYKALNNQTQQAKARRDAIKVMQKDVRGEAAQASRTIAHCHKYSYQEHPWYLRETVASSQASADVYTGERLVKLHFADLKDSSTYELKASALAAHYYDQIQIAGQLAVERASKKHMRLKNSTCYKEHLDNADACERSAKRELERLEGIKTNAEQNINARFAGATDSVFEMDTYDAQKEATYYDPQNMEYHFADGIRHQLVAEYVAMEQRYQAKKSAKAITNQPEPVKVKLSELQHRTLSSHSVFLTRFILKYSHTLFLYRSDDFQKIIDPNESAGARLFLWDILCISILHADTVRYTSRMNESAKAFGQLQRYLTINGYDNAFKRMQNRILGDNKSSPPAGPAPAISLDVSNPALKTGAQAAKYLTRKATNCKMSGRHLFFDSKRKTHDRRLSPGHIIMDAVVCLEDVATKGQLTIPEQKLSEMIKLNEAVNVKVTMSP